jgi:hypothetical protein
MVKIGSFRQIRRDGNVIDEGMAIDRMISLGWGPARISSIQWENNGHLVARDFQFGVLPKLLPSREAIAALVSRNEEQLSDELIVINSDGSDRFCIPNTQTIDGGQTEGVFCWFELSKDAGQSSFGAVFRSDADGSMFQFDINAATGGVINIYRLQR